MNPIPNSLDLADTKADPALKKKMMRMRMRMVMVVVMMMMMMMMMMNVWGGVRGGGNPMHRVMMSVSGIRRSPPSGASDDDPGR